MAYAGAMIEFSKVDAGVSVGVSVQNSLVNDAIVMFGTEEQKKTYLPKLTSGEWLGCFSLTEAGRRQRPRSAPGHGRPRRERFYVLNGTKNFTTNGGFADVIIAFFSTDREKGRQGHLGVPRHQGHSRVSRSASTRTSSASAPRARPRWSSPTAASPRRSLLGQENKGLSIALATLDCGRIGIAAQAVGHRRGRPRGGGQVRQGARPVRQAAGGVRGPAVHARRHGRRRRGGQDHALPRRLDEGLRDERFTKESAMVKLFAAEMSHRVCHKALQIHGGYGYMKEYRVERLYRDQRITEIYEGTSEIQRLVIARSLLRGLRRTR